MLLNNNIPFSYVFGKIKNEVIVTFLYVLFIVCLYSYFNWEYDMNMSVPMILGTVISFLLGFRSNQSYDRWWEARKIWGAIVNDSRSWGREVISFFNSEPEDKACKDMISRLVRRQIAWNFSLGRALRGTGNQLELGKWLDKEDLEMLGHYTNIPMAILTLQGQDIKTAKEKGWINPYQQVTLDESLTRFSNHMGMCERIKNTVFPSTYSMYLKLAMYLFFGLLPFSLVGHVHPWIVVPLETLIAATFWMVEKMSVQLQDPFENRPTDTPMTSIAQTLERDLKQILKEQHIPMPSAPEKDYYLM